MLDWKGARVILLLPLLTAVSLAAILDDADSRAMPSATVCEYYNSTCLSEAAGEGSGGRDPRECYGNMTCPRSELHNCYVVWSRDGGKAGGDGDAHRHSSGHTVKMMGCFLQSDDCQKKDECQETREVDDAARFNHLFCCCRGDMCNANFSWAPRTVLVPLAGDPLPVPSEEPAPAAPNILYTFLFTTVPIIVIVLALAAWFVYRQRKDARDLLASTNSMEQGGHESPPSHKMMDKRIDVRIAKLFTETNRSLRTSFSALGRDGRRQVRQSLQGQDRQRLRGRQGVCAAGEAVVVCGAGDLHAAADEPRKRDQVLCSDLSPNWQRNSCRS
jgi:hypothetical protein